MTVNRGSQDRPISNVEVNRLRQPDAVRNDDDLERNAQVG